LPKRQINCSELMEHCFRRRNGIGHVSQEEITQLRRFVAERRRFVSRLQQDAGDGVSSMRSNSDLTMLPTTDDEEFRKFRPDHSGKSLNNLTRRMKSLRVNSTITSSPTSIIKRRVSSLSRKPSNLSFATTS
jgi:phenylacetate-coenzyme A ligase PaaK-like adenylate-forming protein